MTVTVSAPATTANLGSGFDCVALALDLWNELEVEPGDFAVRRRGRGRRRARDRPHESRRARVRARSRSRPASAFASSTGFRSSAGSARARRRSPRATRRAAAVASKPLSVLELPAEAVALDGHADNLAAAFAGGACLTWSDARRAARAAASPTARRSRRSPSSRRRGVTPRRSRGGLPATVSARDGCRGRGPRRRCSALALATGDAELFALLDRRRAARAVPHRRVAALRGAEGRSAGRCPRRDAVRVGADGDRLGRRSRCGRRVPCARRRDSKTATVTVLAAAATGVVAREVVAP